MSRPGIPSLQAREDVNKLQLHNKAQLVRYALENGMD